MSSELLIKFKNLLQADNPGKKPVIIDATPENLPVISAHFPSTVWSAFGNAPGVQKVAGAFSRVGCANPPRLKAGIVLKQKDQRPLPSKIETWAHQNSPWFANPCWLPYSPSMPRRSMGKLGNWMD